MYENSLDLNTFQNFLNQNSDPKLYEDFVTIATNDETWKNSNRLPGLPTPPSTPGNLNCRYFIEHSPQGIQEVPSLENQVKSEGQFHANENQFLVTQNNFPDCMLSPASSPGKDSFSYENLPNLEGRLPPPYNAHNVNNVTAPSVMAHSSHINNIHNFQYHNNDLNSQYHIQTQLKHQYPAYSEQGQFPINSPQLFDNTNFYNSNNNNANAPTPVQYTINNYQNHNVQYNPHFDHRYHPYDSPNINYDYRVRVGGFQRRTQGQYYQQLAYEQMRQNQQKINGVVGGVEAETELSRATHNVLERQRRNELKMRFSLLRDEIPDLSHNDKAPKIQILIRALEFTNQLKSAEQQLLADLELEKQCRKILLKKLQQLQLDFQSDNKTSINLLDFDVNFIDEN